MNKELFIEKMVELSEKNGEKLTKKQAKENIKLFFETVEAGLIENDSIKLIGDIEFTKSYNEPTEKVWHMESKGDKVKGQTYTSQESYTVRASVGGGLKKKINETLLK